MTVLEQHSSAHLCSRDIWFVPRMSMLGTAASIHLDVYPQCREHSWDGNVRYTKSSYFIFLRVNCTHSECVCCRDIPMPLVSSGVEHGNLRELALARMRDLGTQCRDVRTREVGIQEIHHKVKPYEVSILLGSPHGKQNEKCKARMLLFWLYGKFYTKQCFLFPLQTILPSSHSTLSTPVPMFYCFAWSDLRFQKWSASFSRYMYSNSHPEIGILQQGHFWLVPRMSLFHTFHRISHLTG
jgi:hypothetical protein